MEKGHTSVRRGVSWSPGGGRKPIPATGVLDAPSTECNASWDKRGFMGQASLSPSTNQMERKTNLSRSASVSENELKEARVRSQIIAAQLTIPSNSNSRGVQLFNRRKQRVNAFTLESGGEESGKDTTENGKTGLSGNKLTWAEKSSEEKDRELNFKNNTTKPLWLPTGRAPGGGDIMEEPAEHLHEAESVEDSVVPERHFLPVSEKDDLEEEVKFMKETGDEDVRELRDKVNDDVTPGGDHAYPGRLESVQCEEGRNGVCTKPTPRGKLVNGCHGKSGLEKVYVSKQTTIINRTARPFFSPTTVQSSEPVSPVTDIPPAPSYSTPPLPTFTPPNPVVFSPPPPPPSYPTPPLPAFTCKPPKDYSSPPLMSPIMSPTSPQASHFPATGPRAPANPPMPPYVPRPSTFIPQPMGERKTITQIKTGILDEGTARRATRKSMFTFKEKPVVTPNPELLSLVQGADERKKHGNRSVPEPVLEEELLALGAEASNFLAEEQDKEQTETAKAPEWASCLKSSGTRARAKHRLEQTLVNASGKGAELFAKRQSRMEKYVLEGQKPGQMRSPSPTMSLPPSWVYPSNMPGRVKAIAKDSDVSAQLSQTLQAQQAIRKRQTPKAPPPPPVPEPPPLENGCTKIEMELSRHQPYQLNSSLFILNPIKDPKSSLPRGALPPPKPPTSSQPYSRQKSLPSNPSSNPSSQAQCMSPQPPLKPAGGTHYSSMHKAAPTSGPPRVTSPMAAFSPERVSSPRPGVQMPRPTFSATRAGIEPQTKKDSSPAVTLSETSTPNRTPSLTRRFSSPEGPRAGVWSPISQNHQPPSTISTSRPSVVSPVSPPWGSRCQSPMVSQSAQPSTGSITRPAQTRSTVASPLSPPWDSRCQSPSTSHQPSPGTSTAKPQLTSATVSPVSPPRENRCMSPTSNNLDSKANHRLLAKNIINAAKRKNSPSPGALPGHSLPISPLGSSHYGYECGKPPLSPYQSRVLGAQSPTFTSPPPTPTQRICSPVRLYNTRSLTDSDASVESEDSGLRSPGLRTYNTCPRGWGGSLRVKQSSISTDL